MAVILNYNASVYQSKINTLEGYVSILKTHLDSLESYKNQISSFWDDTDGSRYMDQITKVIVKVRKAMDDVNLLKIMYQENVDEMSRYGAGVDEIISNVDKAIDRQIEVAGVVVDAVDSLIPG